MFENVTIALQCSAGEVTALCTHLMQHDAVEGTTAPAGLQRRKELERSPNSSGQWDGCLRLLKLRKLLHD